MNINVVFECVFILLFLRRNAVSIEAESGKEIEKWRWTENVYVWNVVGSQHVIVLLLHVLNDFIISTVLFGASRIS